MNLIIYDRPARISYYDLDFAGNIKLSAFLKMVHIAADVNATDLGVGFDVLEPLNITFILQRFCVKFLRMPLYGEEVRLRTWAADIIRGIFLREGDMYDINNNKLIEWASQWILFNKKERKILKPSALPVSFKTTKKQGVGIAPIKVTYDPDFGEEYSRYTHEVRYSEVDTNMHMNNSVYGDLIGNSLNPTCSLPGLRIKEVQINYQHEIKHGEKVLVTAAKNKDSLQITGLLNEKRTFVANVEMYIRGE